MSNFQRSRSKVWWNDSPPNILSPTAHSSNWNENNYANKAAEDQDWAPQLPSWVANERVQPAVEVNTNSEVISPKEMPPNQWPLRQGSPGSHKSQDSGFSDSDSSPPVSQYLSSPEAREDKSPSNKSTSSSDSNNNENITVKQAIDFKGTPRSANSLDIVDVASVSSKINDSVANQSSRLRSISVIQTPYDLQKYYEVHNDEEHLKLLKDSTEDIPVKVRPNCDVKITVTTPENVNIKSKNSENVQQKKTFVSTNRDTDNSKGIRIAKVKDLETSKRRSQDSLEYLQVSDNDQIAVNNQPRIRSPISTVLYEPVPDYDQDTSDVKNPRRPSYLRSHSQQHRRNMKEESKFQRNRLNKSLNYEGQRLDQQILDIQDGYHSLNYVDKDISHLKEETLNEEYVHVQPRGFTTKNLMDSLHLKMTKKAGPKAKQRQASKAKGQACSFRIFPTKREHTIVDHHAGGIIEGSRVPFLGLPRYADYEEWVMVGYPEQEKLVQHYHERLIGSLSEVNLNEKPKLTKNTPKSTQLTQITPPSQFQDRREDGRRSQKYNEGLTHDSKREKLKGLTDNFGVQLNMGCTSTPKMLAPHEYMDNATPQLPPKNTRARRINLMDNFNGSVTHEKLNKSATEYHERNIEQTALERISERRPEPVQYWLCDLIGSCETECMTTLQSKALGNDVKASVSASSATITGNIKKVQTHGQIIVHQYSDVIRQIVSKAPNEEQICLLVANINEFVLAHSITLNTKPPGETPERWDKIKKSLQQYLQKLVEIGEDIKLELNESEPEWGILRKHLESLVGIFVETTKAVLVQQLRTLVSIIEEPPSDIILKSTLTSISHLAMLSTESETPLHETCMHIMKVICELPFVDCGVPRALLTAIIESNKSSVKALSLRALATICASGDAVKQFEEGGGIEIISDILEDKSNPEPQMREAITVLTQITAPWLRGHYDLRQLHKSLDPIIRNITDILSRTQCCQLLLLCTACIVNLIREVELTESKHEEGADVVDIITKYKTVERLLETVKSRGPNISVFLQEQTASLINTLSQITRCVRYLSGISVVSVALVCFTRVSPADRETQRVSEVKSQARLVQHTVEAISRLCLLPEVANQIVQLEGVPRLTRLVRMQRTLQPDETSDQVLLHSLKALRTIYKYHPQAFRSQQADVKDMIKPHLMESVMLFSSKKESFV